MAAVALPPSNFTQLFETDPIATTLFSYLPAAEVYMFVRKHPSCGASVEACSKELENDLKVFLALLQELDASLMKTLPFSEEEFAHMHLLDQQRALGIAKAHYVFHLARKGVPENPKALAYRYPLFVALSRGLKEILSKEELSAKQDVDFLKIPQWIKYAAQHREAYSKISPDATRALTEVVFPLLRSAAVHYPDLHASIIPSEIERAKQAAEVKVKEDTAGHAVQEETVERVYRISSPSLRRALMGEILGSPGHRDLPVIASIIMEILLPSFFDRAEHVTSCNVLNFVYKAAFIEAIPPRVKKELVENKWHCEAQAQKEEEEACPQVDRAACFEYTNYEKVCESVRAFTVGYRNIQAATAAPLQLPKLRAAWIQNLFVNIALHHLNVSIHDMQVIVEAMLKELKPEHADPAFKAFLIQTLAKNIKKSHLSPFGDDPIFKHFHLDVLTELYIQLPEEYQQKAFQEHAENPLWYEPALFVANYRYTQKNIKCFYSLVKLLDAKAQIKALHRWGTVFLTLDERVQQRVEREAKEAWAPLKLAKDIAKKPLPIVFEESEKKEGAARPAAERPVPVPKHRLLANERAARVMYERQLLTRLRADIKEIHRKDRARQAEVNFNRLITTLALGTLALLYKLRR